MHNSVEYLNSISFRQLSLQEKIVIKNKGRPLPQLSLQQLLLSSQNKTFVHKFNPNLYDKAPWLCGCSQNNAFVFLAYFMEVMYHGPRME